MKIVIFVLFIIFVSIAFVRYLENTSVFYPSRLIDKTPEALGIAFEDVFIETEDNVRIHGWFVPVEQAKATLLFFHGNAGNISGRLDKIELFHQIGLNVLIIDYRGYGKSEGRPTEKGMYRDARAAFDYLARRKGIDSRKIVVYGASLGGVAAVDLATQRLFSGLIVDSSFSSAVDMAKVVFPFIPAVLIKIKLDSISKIKGITIPKLFFHSKDDQTVPYVLGRKLYEAALDPKEFISINGTHMDGHIYSREKFENGIKEFLKVL